MINLMLGDCLDKMKEIPDQSIDLILTDPPYGTTACKWDSVIPFDKMWKQLHRVIKPNGAICLFGQEPFSSKLRIDNFKNYRYDWIWRKNKAVGFLNSKKMPLRDYEIISTFYKKLPRYNPQFSKGKKYTSMTGGGSGVVYGGAKRILTVNQGIRYPKQILEFTHDKGGYHPTQKPVALLEYLIKTYTNEGETVLDFTMGSGSTGVACQNTNRKFIGIEKDEAYFNIAKQRMFSVAKVAENSEVLNGQV